jgi:hypothetical protein
LRRSESNAVTQQATGSEELPMPQSRTNQHNPAKRKRNRIPPPQRERILQKYAAGKSIVAISSEERRNRETVTRIVHGPEMQQFVRAMREEFCGLGSDAIDAVRVALRENKDGKLGLQVLQSLGVILSPAERLAVPRQYSNRAENGRDSFSSQRD